MTGRYARQMILPEIGAEGQARLARAHVAVVGAGGLGSPVLQYLAGAGVGRITLLDPDTVEETNLHRQPLYRTADLGRPKALAARDHLRAANPEVGITARVEALGPRAAAGLADTCDVVIDAADSYAVSYILSDACHGAGTPLVSASVLGRAGQVGGFCGGAPSLRAVFPDLPPSGATCATAGVMGPVVGLLGAMQAQFALAILLEHAPSPLGRMVSVDMAGLKFGGFSFKGAPEPAQGFRFLGREDLHTGDLVIELRDEAEAPEPLWPAARRLSPEALADLAPQRESRVVLCCATGLRAWRRAVDLAGRGHRDLALMAASACG